MIRAITPVQHRARAATSTTRPRSITIGLEEGTYSSFKNFFPAKKISQGGKQAKKYRPQSYTRIKTQNSDKNPSLSIEPDRIRELLAQRFNKKSGQEQMLRCLTPKISFKPRIKCKSYKKTQSHRLNTISPSESQFEKEAEMAKRLTSLILGVRSHAESMDEQRKIAASPQLYMQRKGSKKRVDSFMYMRKMKAKTEERALNEIKGESMLNIQNKSQRQLFIPKHYKSARKESLLTSYPNNATIKHRSKKITLEKKAKAKAEYRPWSSNNSDKSD